MKRTFYNIFKFLFLFITGGSAYVLIELLYRGRSHISMFIVGALCFILIGLLNERYTYQMSLISQMVISAFIITILEFISGCIVNLWLNLNVWDYSDMPYNFKGQICLLFCNLWCILSLLPIIVDDWSRYWLFHEEKPHYKIL